MNKFWTVLLRIILAVSFVGIVVFVGIVIITNQNIAFEAYNNIVSTREKTDFEALSTKVNSNLKTEYGGALDTYALFIDSAITELNKGIDYHLDYLALEDKLTKGEQDKLRNLYNSYVANFELSNIAYKDYVKAYNDAIEKVEYSFDESNYAKTLVKAKSLAFVEQYTTCYECGSEFFKLLVDVVNRYSLSNKNLYSYQSICYMIKIGLVDHSTKDVIENMEQKKRELNYNNNARSVENIDAYYEFLARENNFDDTDFITQNSFKNFLNTVSNFNVYDWVGDNQAYTQGLKNDNLKQKSTSSFAFYCDNFRG